MPNQFSVNHVLEKTELLDETNLYQWLQKNRPQKCTERGEAFDWLRVISGYLINLNHRKYLR